MEEKGGGGEEGERSWKGGEEKGEVMRGGTEEGTEEQWRGVRGRDIVGSEVERVSCTSARESW